MSEEEASQYSGSGPNLRSDFIESMLSSLLNGSVRQLLYPDYPVSSFVT